MDRAENIDFKLILQACQKKDYAQVTRLLEQAGQYQWKHNDQKTPLHYACEHGRMDIVKLLVEKHNFDPNIGNGIILQTPLYYACKSGHTNIVKYLFSKNCRSDVKDNCGNTLLHTASDNGHVEVMRYLIVTAKLFDPNSVNKDGTTALHLACDKGHLSVVKFLIKEAKCKPFLTNNSGQSALYLASKRGDLLTIKLLIIDGKSNPEWIDKDGTTALQVACEIGYLEIVKFLITEVYCNPDITNQGNTPLQLACCEGNLDIVEFLIAKTQCDLSLRNIDGNNALHLACYKGHEDVVKALIANPKCNPDQVNKDGSTALHFACMGGCINIVKFLVNEEKFHTYRKNHCGNTALHLACIHGHLNVVDFLITEDKCNPDLCNEHGNTALHLACVYGHVDVVEYLINHLCNPCLPNNHSHTALHLACMAGHLNLVKFLTMKGKWYKCNRYDGKTTLHIACENGHLELATFICTIEHCQESDNCGNTALHFACLKGHLEVAKFLVHKAKTKPDQINLDGESALHFSCKGGHLNVASFLINEAKCDVFLRNHNGSTALHVACVNGHQNMAQFLIEKQKFDPNCLNKQKNTALHLASKNGHEHVVKYLINEAKCNLKAINFKGNSALQLSSAGGHVNLVSLFITEHNFNPSFRNSKDGNTALHLACKSGHMHVVEYLVKNTKCKTNLINIHGDTALHFACRSNHLKLVEFLITKGNCNLGLKNKLSGHTALDLACSKKLLDVIYYFVINANCNPKFTYETGDNVLHIACCEGHENLVKALISKAKFDPNATNNDGDTALHLACRKGHLSVAKFLLTEAKCTLNVYNKSGMTALLIACAEGYVEVAKLLIIEAKCDPTLRNNDGKTALHLACINQNLDMITFLITEGKCDSNVVDSNNNTGLHLAAYRGHEDVVKTLITTVSTCNPNLHNIQGNTALHLACNNEDQKIVLVKILIIDSKVPCNPYLTNNKGETAMDLACHKRQLDVVKFFVTKIDTMPDWLHRNKKLNSMLHLACSRGREDIVKTLITRTKCNPFQTSYTGDTALHVACRRGHLNVATLLVTKDMYNADLCNQYHMTALHLACANGHLDLVKFLINKGKFNPGVANKEGNTPLLIACLKGHLNIARFLIVETKCNPNAQNNDGNTALHFVCSEGLTNLSKLLLDVGKCDPNIQNKSGNTPSMLSTNPEITRKLVRYGANPTDVYKMYGNLQGIKHPIASPVRVFVIGNPSAGKSTLTEALKRNNHFFPVAKKVSGVDEKTAGVIPHDLEHKLFGKITIFDFAGQKEFYSSHAAVLQNAILSSPPIFILVVDLSESGDNIKRTTLYWLSFLKNHHSSVSKQQLPHLIVVGSHADVLKSQGEDPKQKIQVVNPLLTNAPFNFKGGIVMDCQYYDSTGMAELRQLLRKSCDDLRTEKSINFNSHCFFVYLLDRYKDSVAVQAHQIHTDITIDNAYANSKGSAVLPRHFLPSSLYHICKLCEELSERGHILYLKNSDCTEKSWVVIDRYAILSKVTGTIFAPEGFREHCKLASSTGVVPFSKISAQLESFNYNCEMLIRFLCHLEFCQEISDREIIKMIEEQDSFHVDDSKQSLASDDRYFFFPGLIHLNIPSKVWDSESKFIYQCGWILKCTESDEFFTSQFLHVLLLRLAFTFAFPHNNTTDDEDNPAIQRKCSIWKNGIYWGNRDGVEALVELVNHNTAVTFFTRSQEVQIQSLQLRSSVIQKILETANQLCPNIKTVESLADSSKVTHYPLQPISQLAIFNLKEIAQAVVSEKMSVVSNDGHPLLLKELLCFEPYAHLSIESLLKLFKEEISTQEVDDFVLLQVAKSFLQQKDMYMIVELFEPNSMLLAGKIAQSSAHQVNNHELVCPLQKWRKRSEGTYQCLREKLNQLSIFVGRNPLELAGINAQIGTTPNNTCQSMDSGDKLYPQGKLCVNDLRDVQAAIWEARIQWYNIGIALDFQPTSLSVIKENNRDSVDKCFTTMLIEWLKTNPSWSDLVAALKSPTVNFPLIADEVYARNIHASQTSDKS